MNKCWNFEETEAGRSLHLNGYIAEESWLDDDVTPKAFKGELEAGKGDLTVWINSPGGDVFAASQIYTMLKEYSGKVTVKVDGIAASAASMIAMAGKEVYLSPTAMMMIHNPATFVWGEEADLKQGMKLLSEVKEAILNAYETRTGLSRSRLSAMMDAETWMSAGKAVDLGFADGVLYVDGPQPVTDFLFDRLTITNHLRQKWPATTSEVTGPEPEPETPAPTATPTPGIPAAQLYQRLNLIK